jgi:AbrB family looped-hinge helix DNA binding protein
MKTSTSLPGSKVRLSTKGQLVVPKEIRERFGWTAGAELVFEDWGDHVVLRQWEDVPETRLSDLIGCTGYKGPAKSLEEMAAGIAEGALRNR